MAAPSIRQDYIARIRYSNTLPPPPNPPKLLDIPNTGLSSGQYTSAGFASRLAREQPLNIEADAELGMPIDLVGLPGVFDGDETVIQALDPPPAPHPADRALLRPLATLGKPSSITSGVSFLRRTEYITSTIHGGRTNDVAAQREAMRARKARQKRRTDVAKDDPINILRHIIKGFDIAYPNDAYTGEDSTSNIRGAEITSAEREAWRNPRHPAKPDVRLLDSYPVLPDPEGVPDTGAYMILKYITNPLANTNEYDQRLDVAILRPLEQSEEYLAKLEAGREAHKADPVRYPVPLPQYDYEIFLPQESSSITGIKRKFDVMDAEKDDDGLYTGANRDSGKPCFPYKRLRAYETYQQNGDGYDWYGDSVAMALHDAEMHAGAGENRLRTGAYYYPVVQRTFIRPKRTGAVTSVMGMPAPTKEEEKIDFLDLYVKEPVPADELDAEGEIDETVEADV